MATNRKFFSFKLDQVVKMLVVHFVLLFSFVSGLNYAVDECRRLHRPVIDVPKTPGDNGFRLKIAQDLDTYSPGQNYTITLQGWRTQYSVQKFIGFWIRATPRDGRIRASSAGKFEHFNEAIVTYAGHCTNVVTNRTSVPRSEVQLLWRAPRHGSGCIQIRATVMEYRNIWYQEEGGLVKELCEAEQSDQAASPVASQEGCCACDDAKFELSFTGVWSPQTHPKDFPTTQWFTHFSDIIGATHTSNFKIYEVGGYASDGLKQLAEWGKTQELEKELKTKTKDIRTIVKARGSTHPKDFPTTQWFTHFSDIIGATHTSNFKIYEVGGYASDGLKQLAEWGKTQELEKELKTKTKDIRTIVKARGLWYPNLNGQTHAVFRTDQKHHLLSLASMFGPSPDWLVGIDSLNLCLKNCSWTDRKELDLLPFDAGTDGGVTYMAENSPTNPRERIHNITSRYPKNPNSPFYDPMGKPMTPLAKLVITRMKIYEKSCGDPNPAVTSEEVITTSNSDQKNDQRVACTTNEWNLWSPCEGGSQMRTRTYRNPAKASMAGCTQELFEKQMCARTNENEIAVERSADPDTATTAAFNCMTSPWSEWTECSTTCGSGLRTRSRMYKEPMGEKFCNEPLTEKEECSAGDCHTPSPECQVTNWSNWSPCSVTCGRGTSARRRQYLRPRDATSCQVTLIEKRGCIANRTSCDFDPMEQKVVCMQPKAAGSCYGFMQRWYFDFERGVCQPFVYSGCRGNMNNFGNYEECNIACERAFENTEGQNLISNSIEPAYFSQMAAQLPSAMIQNGMICAPLPSAAPSALPTIASLKAHHTGPPVDCQVSTYSSWGPCSVSCGKGFQDRYREVVVRPQNGGQTCPSKLEQRRKCVLPPCKNQYCVFGEWSEWMSCTKSCGNGIQQRIRMITKMPSSEMQACAYVPVETRVCPDLPSCDTEENDRDS